MSTEGFSSELSEDLTAKYDMQSNLGSDIVGGAVATVADFGATVWNSLTPKSMEYTTQDLLSNIDSNALRVYNENPDTIQTASFIGGMLVPTGLAMKGMSAARSGMKGVNFFSEAGQVAQKTKMLTAFENAGMASAQARNATYGFYAMSAANALADAVAMEGALVLTMNAHPYMEDYMKDPLKNFAYGVATLGVLGGGLAHIGDRFAVKGIKTGVEQKAWGIAREGYKDVEVSANLSGQMAGNAVNIQNWEGILASSKKLGAEAGPVRELNNFETNLLETLIVREKQALVKNFEAMASKDILTLDAVSKTNLINMIAEDPVKFAGIDSIRFATVSEELGLATKSKGLVESTALKPMSLGKDAKSLEFPLADLSAKGNDIGVTMVYSPRFNSFMRTSDLKHYSTAVDLIQDSNKLTNGMSNNWHMVPRYDFAFESSRMSSAAVDADFLRNLKYYDTLDIKNFTNGSIAIDPSDIASLQAVHARITREGITDAKITLTKEKPNYGTVGSQIIERVITKTITKTVDKGTGTITRGVDKSVMDKFTAYLRRPNLADTDLMSPKNMLSKEARELARSFSLDQMWPMHNAMEIAKRKNQIPQKLMSEEQALKWGSDSYKSLRKQGLSHEQAMERVGSETSNLGKYAEELLNSAETKKLKQDLMQFADGEGYIYLYRGQRGRARGHSPGESYTPDYKVALQFAGGDANNVSLYRVHPDEVIGHLGSYGGAHGGEAEILLDVPTRVVAGKPQVIQGTSSSGHSVEEVMSSQEIKEIIKKGLSKEESLADVDQVYARLVEAKQSQATSLIDQGVPLETISLHTNIPMETLEQYLATGSKDLGLVGSKISSYTDAASIPTYLAPENRALSVSTNMNKVPLARIKSQLNTLGLDAIDSQAKINMLLTSRSEILREVGNYLESPLVKNQVMALRSELDKVVAANVGGTFTSSSDFALRDLGLLGVIATQLGKDVTNLSNKGMAKIWEPLKPFYTSISKDQAALVELNTAMNVNAGLKGYRTYENGRFLVQDQNMPWKEILDSSGKVIGKERNMIPVEYQGKVFEIKTPTVDKALQTMQGIGREFFEMKGTNHSILGKAPINDLGFWAPPFNPRNKVLTYVEDLVTGKTSLIYGKDATEMDTLVNAYKSSLSPEKLRTTRFINKSEQKAYNDISFREDPIFMEMADSGLLHSGSSTSAIVNTNADILSDLVNGYEHTINYNIRSSLDAQLSDVMAKLDQLSYVSQLGYKDQNLNFIQKALQKPKDPGMIMKNTIMGNSNLNQYEFWKKTSDVTNIVAEYGLQTISKIAEPILDKAKSLVGKGKLGSDEVYTNLTKELERRGIVNPFAGMDDHLAKEVFHVQSISQAPNMTPRILALSNATSATLMLKFLELGQPLVNALSLPILTSAAMGRKMEQAFMGGVLDSSARFGVVETMYGGVRWGGTVEGKALLKMGEEGKLFESVISEATEALAHSRNLTPGMVTTVEKALESNFVKVTGKMADLSEEYVRKTSFLTGAYMAKKAYPGISQEGIYTFARSFMDQAVGNYSSVQRPTMFQGTLGVAMGLFQTYMVTFTQDIYRLIELKNWKSLAKTMLAQETIFGAKSLPGFNFVSEQIGEHFSDKNVDLTTGTFRALPDWMADMVLYGLPSQLGPSITTRGDIQPRIPNVLGNGVGALPAFNILGQALKAGDRLVEAAFTADASTGKAMLEALSMQNVSRPIARMSEFFSGHSITQKGNLIAGPEEIYTWPSIAARVFATRPLQESKAREAIHLNTLYGSIDRKARDEVTMKLKTHIRDGNLNPEIVEKLGSEYMRTGSPTGWRSAVNHAIGQTSIPASNTVRNYLRPNTPFQMMIDDVD